MTKLQLEVLTFIDNYIETSGISPTYNEIREYCGLSAVSQAQKIVRALEKNGHIKMATTGIRKIIRPPIVATKNPTSSLFSFFGRKH
jgi:repressor LexA